MKRTQYRARRFGARRSLLIGLIILLPIISHAQPVGVQPVEVRFVKSSYADFMFYLLYRSTRGFPQLETAVPLGEIPQLDPLISLAEQVASNQPKRYEEIERLLEPYRTAKKPIEEVPGQPGKFRKLAYSDELPSYQQLEETVRQGEKTYPSFQAFWKQNIAPAEQSQIDLWARQLKECDPFDKLQRIGRLSFPFQKMDVASIALHLAGSANSYPAGIYSGVFKKPDLAWTVGHEGTHLLVDQNTGHNWRSYPLANEAVSLIEQHGGKASNIEESLSLFMQIKLSQACGYTDASSRISEKFAADSPVGAILRSLESGWNGYEADRNQDIIVYLLNRTITAFPQGIEKAN